MSKSVTMNRRDIEAAILGVIFGYETVAIALRKTRWTTRVPPLTRIITRSMLLEGLTLAELEYHFINHRTKQVPGVTPIGALVEAER